MTSAAKKKKTPAEPAAPKPKKTTLELLTEETRTANSGAAETERTDSTAALVKLNDLVVNGHNMELAGEILHDVHERHEKLKRKLQSITKPMREAENAVRAFFRPALNAWAEAESILKTKIKTAQNLQLAVNIQTTQIAQKQLESGDARAAALTSQALGPTSLPDGVSTAEHWTHEVTDEALVPREYCSPSDKKLRAALALGKRDIPGVRIYRDDIVSVRG